MVRVAVTHTAFTLNFHPNFLFVLFSIVSLSCPIPSTYAQGTNNFPVSQFNKEHLSLQDCLNLALVNTKSLQIEKDELKLNALDLENAEAGKVWPSLTAALKYKYSNESSGPFDDDAVEAQMRISYNILDFYNNAQKMWSALSGKLNSEIEMEKQIREVSINTATAFFNMLLKQKQVALGNIELARQKRQFKKIKILNQTGMASRFDLMQMERDLMESELAQEQRGSDMQLARMKLASAIGWPLDTEFQINEMTTQIPPRTDWQACKSTALRCNREIQIQKKILEQIPHYRKLFRRAKWPKVRADAFYGDDIGRNDFDKETELGVRIVFSKPIFDAGITRRKIEKWNIRLNIIGASIAAFETDFINHIRILHEQVKIAENRVTKEKTKLQMASKVFETAKRSFDLHAITLKQLLDSQDRVKQIEIQYAQAMTDLLRASFMLDIFTGNFPLEQDG